MVFRRLSGRLRVVAFVQQHDRLFVERFDGGLAAAAGRARVDDGKARRAVVAPVRPLRRVEDLRRLRPRARPRERRPSLWGLRRRTARVVSPSRSIQSDPAGFRLGRRCVKLVPPRREMAERVVQQDEALGLVLRVRARRVACAGRGGRVRVVSADDARRRLERIRAPAAAPPRRVSAEGSASSPLRRDSVSPRKSPTSRPPNVAKSATRPRPLCSTNERSRSRNQRSARLVDLARTRRSGRRRASGPARRGGPRTCRSSRIGRARSRRPRPTPGSRRGCSSAGRGAARPARRPRGGPREA